jgi:Domain of unknown function (DUF4291)
MLITEPYLDQLAIWPPSGRHILAQFDAESIIVYQAFEPSIAQYAIDHGFFGGDFSYERMSWIKTNFLWMMYRSGWGTKLGQEMTLAIRLKRSFFNQLLGQAIELAYDKSRFDSLEDWRGLLARSSVRAQWDPDHHPTGQAVLRRALQLGLRGRVLKEYGRHQILEMINISGFVAQQRDNISPDRHTRLELPRERVYLPENPTIHLNLQLDDYPSGSDGS